MDMLVVIYALIALTYQVLYLIAPIKAFLNLSGLNILSSVIAILGALLLAVDFFSQRICLKARYSSLLFVTLVVLGISSVIHSRYGISGNLKVLIWQAVQMLLIYSAYKRLSLYQMYHVILGTHTAFSVIFVPTVIVSLIQWSIDKLFFAMKCSISSRWFSVVCLSVLTRIYPYIIKCSIMLK